MPHQHQSFTFTFKIKMVSQYNNGRSLEDICLEYHLKPLLYRDGLITIINQILP
ncbi:hypothetical protein LFU01_45700 [Lysinibacillus fusiformis]|nr:hypothetical protein LFU01_45700 [Lysinibacillus fusiformis]